MSVFQYWYLLFFNHTAMGPNSWYINLDFSIEKGAVKNLSYNLLYYEITKLQYCQFMLLLDKMIKNAKTWSSGHLMQNAIIDWIPFIESRMITLTWQIQKLRSWPVTPPWRRICVRSQVRVVMRTPTHGTGPVCLSLCPWRWIRHFIHNTWILNEQYMASVCVESLHTVRSKVMHSKRNAWWRVDSKWSTVLLEELSR